MRRGELGAHAEELVLDARQLRRDLGGEADLVGYARAMADAGLNKGTAGNLSLRADASATEVASRFGAKGMGDGLGGVTIAARGSVGLLTQVFLGRRRAALGVQVAAAAAAVHATS